MRLAFLFRVDYLMRSCGDDISVASWLIFFFTDSHVNLFSSCSLFFVILNYHNKVIPPPTSLKNSNNHKILQNEYNQKPVF